MLHILTGVLFRPQGILERQAWGVDLTGVTNDGLALNKAYLTKLPVFIDQPIYIGNTQIDISQFRWEGISLNLYGINPQKVLFIHQEVVVLLWEVGAQS